MKTIKHIVLVGCFLLGGALFSQDQKIAPLFEKDGELVKATFFYEDGSISQQGTIKDGKLHGEWISYDREGNKSALARYKDGSKTGKWFFWVDGTLKEVNYQNSKIASVNIWKDKEVQAFSVNY